MWCCADFLQSDNVIASKADTMVETITHIDLNYGGVRGYCKAISLSDEEVARIRTNFMKQVTTCTYWNPPTAVVAQRTAMHYGVCVKKTSACPIKGSVVGLFLSEGWHTLHPWGEVATQQAGTAGQRGS